MLGTKSIWIICCSSPNKSTENENNRCLRNGKLETNLKLTVEECVGGWGLMSSISVHFDEYEQESTYFKTVTFRKHFYLQYHCNYSLH